jgi:hypothetical protein
LALARARAKERKKLKTLGETRGRASTITKDKAMLAFLRRWLASLYQRRRHFKEHMGDLRKRYCEG